MTVNKALQILNEKKIKVEMKWTKSFDISGEYTDMAELIEQPRRCILYFHKHSKAYDDNEFGDYAGYYLIDQTESSSFRWFESHNVGLQVIVAMRTIAHEVATY